MWLTSSQRHATDGGVSEEFADYQQQQQEQYHRHHDDVVTDTHADLQPAAVVAHQEEKVLQQMHIHRLCLCMYKLRLCPYKLARAREQ